MSRFLVLVLGAAILGADDGKLTDEQRIELLRGLTAEYATVKAPLPRSKKPLPFPAKGDYDKAAWKEAEGELGPAAKVGDLIQVTRVSIESDKVLLEINGGVKSGKKWYERVEVGMGGRTQPIGRDGTPTAGTNIAVIFEKRVPPITAADFKALLKPVLDFEKRTVTESYIDTLPPPVQAAIKEKRVIEGMDREQVLLALGRPRHKTRSSVDGLETEDWVYGLPPGKISFITFNGNKVVKVKDSYAGLGGSTAETLPPR